MEPIKWEIKDARHAGTTKLGGRGVESITTHVEMYCNGQIHGMGQKTGNSPEARHFEWTTEGIGPRCRDNARVKHFEKVRDVL